MTVGRYYPSMIGAPPPVLDFNFKITGDELIARRFRGAYDRVRIETETTLEYLARQVVEAARRRAPRSGSAGGREQRGATRKGKARIGTAASAIGYRFALGMSGLTKETGSRVVIRGDYGAKSKSERGKIWALEMGHSGKTKQVSGHRRNTRTSRVTRVLSGRTGWQASYTGGAKVRYYRRRFANVAQPYIGPAGRELEPQIINALTVSLPRRLARIVAGETA